jgi:hypothetical protein
MNLRFWHPCLPAIWLMGCLHLADKGTPSAQAGAAAPARAATLVSTAPATVTDPATAEARVVVRRALVFLERDGDWWMTGGPGVPGGGKCVSCHVVTFSLWSHREAERAGVPIAKDRIGNLEKRAFGHFVERPSKAHSVTWSQLLLARERSGPNEEARSRWREVREKIVADQEKEGYWEAGGQFPQQQRPERESDAVATMWTLLAMDTPGDQPPSVAESRKRAWGWVKTLPAGESNEWLLTRLLVERQLGTARTAESFLTRLLERQHPDGGWSWLADPGKKAPSDALSTGQALYALRLAGLGPDHPSVRKAVDYLVRNQQEDGTWIVASKLISTRTEGGKIEYIYKYWGTAWATIGLARTLHSAPTPAE